MKLGAAMVSVKAALWQKFEGTVPTATVLVEIDYPIDAQPFVTPGWAYDKNLISKLTGLPVKANPGPKPLPVNFSASTDADEKLRGIMRSVQRDPKEGRTEISTQEIRAVPGQSYLWLLTFERPGPNAKRLLIDLDAADLGGTGRIRFSIPSQAKWKANG